MATFIYDINKKQRGRIIRNILLLIPGIAGDFLIHSSLIRNERTAELLGKLDMVYLVIISIMIASSLLTAFQEAYSRSERNRYHPLKGLVQAIQVIMVFVGGIVIVSILIDKSPTALLTGLGASAAEYINAMDTKGMIDNINSWEKLSEDFKERIAAQTSFEK